MIRLAGFFKNNRICVLLAGLLCLVVPGCMPMENGSTKHSPPQNTAAYNTEKLLKYKTAYVGDNSKVAHIIDNLPYAHLRKEISLQTKTVPYGITVNYNFIEANIDTKQVESNFCNNAIIMFALIDNADVITFNVNKTNEQYKYRYSRAESQKNFNQDLRKYPEETGVFETFLNNLAFRLRVFPEKYATVMSSTPGIRISAEYPGNVGKLRCLSEQGSLFTWNAPAGKVSKGLQKIELVYGRPVYWSPVDPDGRISQVGNNVIEVILLDEKGEKIADKQVNIIYDGSFYTVKPSPGIIVGAETKSQNQQPKNVDDAVSLAIKGNSTSYRAGETTAEGHLILDTGEKDGIVKVYTIASIGNFGFENGIFTKISGSGAIPTVIIFQEMKMVNTLCLNTKSPWTEQGI